MNSNETRTLWISVAAALVAVMLFYSYTQEKKAEYDKKYGAFRSVVVAAEDITEMETIIESKVEMSERPKDFIEPDALEQVDLAVGQVAAAPIKKGEQILQTKLLTPGPYTGISMQVSPQKRAVTIPIDEMRGVAKLIRPGDRIDLVAALDFGSGPNKTKEVKTIMQDVIVLATGVRVVNNIPRLFEADSSGKNVTRVNLTGDTSFNNITVEATPQEAQDLIFILATAPGSLFATLRNPNDRIMGRMPASTIDSVLGRVNLNMLKQQIVTPAPQPAPQATPPPRPQKRRTGNFEELGG